MESTPLTTKLYEAKAAIQHVMDRYPEEAYGSAWLEEALALIGRAADEVESVEDPMFAPGTEAQASS